MNYNINKRRGDYTISSALRVGGTRKPRTTTLALTDCLVTRSDGSQYTIERNTRSSRKSTHKTPRATVSRTQPTRRTTFNLFDHSTFNVQGDQNH